MKLFLPTIFLFISFVALIGQPAYEEYWSNDGYPLYDEVRLDSVAVAFSNSDECTSYKYFYDDCRLSKRLRNGGSYEANELDVCGDWLVYGSIYYHFENDKLVRTIDTINRPLSVYYSVDVYKYDSDGRISAHSIDWRAPLNGWYSNSRQSYSYNSDNKLCSESYDFQGENTSSETSSKYAYDSLCQLIKVTSIEEERDAITCEHIIYDKETSIQYFENYTLEIDSIEITEIDYCPPVPDSTFSLVVKKKEIFYDAEMETDIKEYLFEENSWELTRWVESIYNDDDLLVEKRESERSDSLELIFVEKWDYNSHNLPRTYEEHFLLHERTRYTEYYYAYRTDLGSEGCGLFTGVASHGESADAVVYPNPSSDAFYFETTLSSDKKERLEVYGMDGSYQLTIDLSDKRHSKEFGHSLASGVYIISYFIEGQLVWSNRVIKI